MVEKESVEYLRQGRIVVRKAKPRNWRSVREKKVNKVNYAFRTKKRISERCESVEVLFQKLEIRLPNLEIGNQKE